MHEFKFLEFPFDEDAVIDMYKEKINDRNIHVLLCITIHELCIKELIKVLVCNGFDGVLLSGIGRHEEDTMYIQSLYKCLYSMPAPYSSFKWDIIASISRDFDKINTDNLKMITGIVYKGNYKQFNIPRIMNNIDYHSTKLYKIRNDMTDVIEYQKQLDNILSYYITD